LENSFKPLFVYDLNNGYLTVRFRSGLDGNDYSWNWLIQETFIRDNKGWLSASV